jgi:hypothetical protein
MAQNIYHTKRGVVITTNATATTLDTYTVPEKSVTGVEVTVVARDASNNPGLFKQAAAVTKSTGSASIVGSVLNLITPILSVSLATATVTIDTSGSDIRLRATGVAATTIEWQFEWEIITN